MPTITITGHTVMSQNRFRGKKWYFFQKERKKWGARIAPLVREDWMTDAFRKITITAVRPRKIKDFANLVGGCKELVDALVWAGVLADDSEEMCLIEYKQQVGNPAVIISWEDEQ